MMLHRAEEILRGLDSLRQDEILCDVQLEAEGERIPAHKAVLAAASPYFKAMFAGNFSETRLQVVEIKEISSLGLKTIIDCIYTTNLDLSAANIKEVFMAAHLMQMNDILDECKEWMKKNITNANCFTMLQLAERFTLEDVMTTVHDLIVKNFVAVSKSDMFTDISKQALIDYLSSDMLYTNTDEFEVFKSAKNWILANEIPSEGVCEILSQVRFGLIAPDKLMDEILPDTLVAGNRGCLKVVRDAMIYHTNQYTQPFCQETWKKPRGRPGLVVIPGGVRGDGFDTVNDTVNLGFFHLPDLHCPDPGLVFSGPLVYRSLCSVQIENFLYVFGATCNGYQNFTKRYDASTDRWIELTPIPRQCFAGSTMAHFQNEIFCFGGIPVDKNSTKVVGASRLTDEVYVYNIQENLWSEGTNMPEKSAYAASSELQGHVYVTGGVQRGRSARVYAFDTRARIWLTKPGMNHQRCRHVLQPVKEKLYAIGGTAENDVHCQSIEMYDPISNQWYILSVEFRETGLSSCVAGNSIYLVGGHLTPYDVYVFDVDKEEITEVDGTLPFSCRQSISAYMILPKLL